MEKSPLAVLTRSAYPVGIAIALFPVADVSARLLPTQISNATWRFGAVGLLMSGPFAAMLIGLLLLAFVSAYRGNRVMLTIVAFAAAMLSAVVLGLLLVFGLDAIQMRSIARPEFKAAFVRSAVTSTIAGVLTSTGFASLAHAAYLARRSLSSRVQAHQEMASTVRA